MKLSFYNLSERRLLVILFLAAFVVRLVFFGGLLFHYGPGSFYLDNSGAGLVGNDTQDYVTIAKNLAEGNGYSRFASAPFEPDSMRSPLAPFLLSPFIYFFGFSKVWLAILFLDLILSATGVMAYLLAKPLIRPSYAFWVGFAVAVNPLLAYRANIAEADGHFVLLLLAALYFFVRFWQSTRAKDLYLTALFLGLLVLAKPVGTYVIFMFAIFAVLRLAIGRVQFARAVRIFACGALIIAAVTIPWLTRNRLEFGVWGISAIRSYSLYAYLTDEFKLPNEAVLPEPGALDREPIRNLRNAPLMSQIASERIRAQPTAYASSHLVGALKNAFASDFTQFYYNGHAKLLPFSYHPEHKVNFTELLLSRRFTELTRAVFVPSNLLYLLRYAVFAAFYALILASWAGLWRNDRQKFWLFTFFLLLCSYFFLSPGPFTDPKYRLPVVPLLILMFVFAIFKRARLAPEESSNP